MEGISGRSSRDFWKIGIEKERKLKRKVINPITTYRRLTAKFLIVLKLQDILLRNILFLYHTLPILIKVYFFEYFALFLKTFVILQIINAKINKEM